MASLPRNRPAPSEKLEESPAWRDYLNYLAYVRMDGLLLPDFASDPTNTGGEYRIYFNTTLNRPRYYNGTVWVTI